MQLEKRLLSAYSVALGAPCWAPALASVGPMSGLLPPTPFPALDHCTMSSEYTINEQGERVIAASRRPDGTLRKERRVRAGYVPQDEVAVYQSRGTQVGALLACRGGVRLWRPGGAGSRTVLASPAV